MRKAARTAIKALNERDGSLKKDIKRWLKANDDEFCGADLRRRWKELDWVLGNSTRSFECDGIMHSTRYKIKTPKKAPTPPKKKKQKGKRRSRR